MKVAVWGLLLFLSAASQAKAELTYLFTLPRFAAFNEQVTGFLFVRGVNQNVNTKMHLFITNSNSFSTSTPVDDASVLTHKELTLSHDTNVYDVVFPATDKNDDLPFVHVRTDVDGVKAVLSAQLNAGADIARNAVGKGNIFVETDRTFYKPAQTNEDEKTVVKFLVLRMENDLKPSAGPIQECAVKDPSGKDLQRWTNVELNHGLARMEYELIMEPDEGEYSIVCSDPDIVEKVTFKVEEYVPPTFETTIVTTDSSLADPDITATVCGVYTIGRPVPGRAEITVCHLVHWWFRGRRSIAMSNDKLTPTNCVTTKHDLVNGCVTIEVGTSKSRDFSIKATVIESGTEHTYTTEKEVRLSSEYFKFSLLPGYDAYRPNDPERLIKIRVDYAGGSPAINEKVDVVVDAYNETTMTTKAPSVKFDNVAVQSDGAIDVSLPEEFVAESAIQVTVRAKTDAGGRVVLNESIMGRYLMREIRPGEDLISALPFKTFVLRRWRSASSHSLILRHKEKKIESCTSTVTIAANYGGANGNKDLHYVIVSRNRIVKKGVAVIDDKIEFQFVTDRSWSPKIGVVAFVFVPGQDEVVSDSLLLDTPTCLQNDVSLTADKNVRPGDEATLQLTAASNSMCGLRGVDKSAELLEAVERISTEAVMRKFPSTHEKKKKGCEESFEDFFEIDLQIVGNLVEEKCKALLEGFPNHRQGDFRVMEMAFDDAMAGAGAVAKESVSEPMAVPEEGKRDTVRKDFPETWLWKLVDVTSGSVELNEKVPDTNTEWLLRAVCLSTLDGLGISEEIGIIAQLPFFARVHVPYKSVRGERLPLKVQVFNNLKKCVRFNLEFETRGSMTIEDPEDGKVGCVCFGETFTKKFHVTPTEAGEVELNVTATTGDISDGSECGGKEFEQTVLSDKVVRKMLVVVEGFEQEVDVSKLICINNAGAIEKYFNLAFHDDHENDIVEDSVRVMVEIIGDPMGQALGNLGNLVRMPTGCGEQTMIIMAPNVYVLKYLAATKQVEPEMQELAKYFALKGYNRERLNFRHSDGSFSAFKSLPGSSWLTAFVIRCFAQARPVLTTMNDIENVLQTGVDWLFLHQNKEGTFGEPGQVLHSEMQSSTASSFSLTAYITVAILTSGIDYGNKLDKTFNYLHGQLANRDDTTKRYAFILTGYGLARSGRIDMTDWISYRTQNAIRDQEQGFLYWLVDDSKPALNVEATSYALLWILTESDPNKNDIIQIVSWLTTQRQQTGGFVSTQDTVVGLQALSEAAITLYAPSPDLILTADWSSLTDSTRTVRQSMNADNRLVLQRNKISENPENLKLKITSVTAPGICLTAHAVMKYNIRNPPKLENPISDHWQVTFSNTNKARVNGLKEVKVCVVSKENQKLTMPIAEVQLETGFKMIVQDVAATGMTIQRKELSNEGATCNIYLDELALEKDKEVCFILPTEQETEVANAKAGQVSIYEYYEPSHKKSFSFKMADLGSDGDGGASQMTSCFTLVLGALVLGRAAMFVLLGALD